MASTSTTESAGKKAARGGGLASAVCPPAPAARDLRPAMAADANESVLLSTEMQSVDDDVRTRMLLLSQHADEIQDAVNLACRHTNCSARDPKKPKSKHQWHNLLMGIQTGQLLWTEILAGTHCYQAHHTKMQLEMTKGLIRQYEGPGKVVIVDYTSVRPQFVSISEQTDDLPPLWQEFANAASLKLQAVCLCTWGLRHSQDKFDPTE